MPMYSQGGGSNEVRGSNAKLSEDIHHLCICHIVRPAAMGLL